MESAITQEVDYQGMMVGVGIACMLFFCVLCSNRIFNVSEEEYEKTIEKYGDAGKRFILEQKKRHGNKYECNNKIWEKMRHQKVEEYYKAKDERRRKENAAKYDDKED